MPDHVTGTVYMDPGDRLAGKYDPPRRCVVVTRWRPGARPRNVCVRYEDGSTDVIPLHPAPATGTAGDARRMECLVE